MKSTFLFSSYLLPLHPTQTELIQGQSTDAFTGSHQAIGGYLTLVGPLGYGVLRRVIDHLPVVFDVFRWQPDFTGPEPQIRINRHFQRPALPVFDLSGEPNPNHSANDWLKQRFNTPLGIKQEYFDLALLQISDTEHRLLIRGHRLLLDDTGFDQLVRYIAEAYALVSAGQKLPKSAPAYAEDAASARLYSNSLAYSESTAHWQKQFPVLPEQLLTGLRLKENEQPDVYQITARNSLSRAISQASAVCQVSEECLLLAAFTAYFSRLTGKQTCVFGRVVSGRETKRQRQVVGQFNRLLPIRCRHKPGQSVRMLLRTIKHQKQYDNSYRHHPMSQLVATTGAIKSTRSHLFDILLKVLPPVPEVNMAGLNCRVERFAAADSDLPLQLFWQPASAHQASALHVIGQSHMLNEHDTHWMLHQIEQLVVRFAHWPDASVDSFDIALPPSKRLYTRLPASAVLPTSVSQ